MSKLDTKVLDSLEKLDEMVELEKMFAVQILFNSFPHPEMIEKIVVTKDGELVPLYKVINGSIF